MSLYNMEEVCRECTLAHWHSCDKCYDGRKFCHCEDNHESSVDCVRGECEYKEIEWRTPKGWTEKMSDDYIPEKDDSTL